MDSCRAAFKKVNGPGLSCVVGNRKLWRGRRGVLMLVLVLCRAAWQTAGGSSWGKLKSWDSGNSADGRVEDRLVGGEVKDEGISPNDTGRGGAGIGTGLWSDRGAGMATGGEVPE